MGESRWMRNDKYKNAQDMQSMDNYNDSKVVRANKSLWFINGDLVRVHHKSRGEGTITLYNITQDKFQGILADEWVKKRKRAYGVRQAGLLLNRNPQYLSHLYAHEVIKAPLPANKDGKRARGFHSYYSEEDIFELRDFFSTRHWGRARKDGLVTNNTTPTRAELKRKMGDGILHYTKNNQGEIVPIWSESI